MTHARSALTIWAILTYYLPKALLLALVSALVAVCALTAADKTELLRQMDTRAPHYGEVSRKIWESPAIGAARVRLRRGIRSRRHPYRLNRHLGQSKPLIVIMGEYDAVQLPPHPRGRRWRRGLDGSRQSIQRCRHRPELAPGRQQPCVHKKHARDHFRQVPLLGQGSACEA